MVLLPSISNTTAHAQLRDTGIGGDIMGIPHFILSGTLSGHTRSVNCLAISRDGKYILSGGDDRSVIIWSLPKQQLLQKISCSLHGAISALVWISTAAQKVETWKFAFACADGTIHFYSQSVPNAKFTFSILVKAHRGPVEDLAFDPYHCRLASAGDGTAYLWSAHDIASVSKLPVSPPVRPYICRSVNFLERGRKLLVAYLESHETFCYTVDPWTILWTQQAETRIGNLAVSDDEHMAIVANLSNGTSLYTLPYLQYQRSFVQDIHYNFPLSISFAWGNAVVVTGSDNGMVMVYDTATGQELQRLVHSRAYDKQLVQSISTYSNSNICVIVSASATSGSQVPSPASDCPVSIKVWTSEQSKTSSDLRNAIRIRRWVWIIIIAVGLYYAVLHYRVQPKLAHTPPSSRYFVSSRGSHEKARSISSVMIQAIQECKTDAQTAVEVVRQGRTHQQH